MREILGTDTDDLLHALSNDDFLYGLDGNDFLIIGEGSDKNYGGTGFDVAVFEGIIDDFSGVSGILDAYRITDNNPSDSDLGFDRVKAVEIFAFDDALFDTRTGARQGFATEADLVSELARLIATEDVIS